jgi:hypothetical protein
LSLAYFSLKGQSAKFLAFRMVNIDGSEKSIRLPQRRGMIR